MVSVIDSDAFAKISIKEYLINNSKFNFSNSLQSFSTASSEISNKLVLAVTINTFSKTCKVYLWWMG